MNQQELEALLRQIAPNNDPGRLEFTEATEQVDVTPPADPDAITVPKPQKKTVRVLQWVDRGTGQTLRVQADPTTGGHTKVFQGVDPKQQGEPATTAAQQAAATGATSRKPVAGKPGVYEVTTTGTDASGRATTETHYENDAGQTVPTPTAPPQVIPSTLNTTSPNMGIQMPDGSITWQPNPNHNNPSPKPLTIPNTRIIYWDDGKGGPPRAEKNPAYVKPSKIQPHPSDPRRMINVTEDDDGNPIILPVDDRTVVKPADLPVLQTRFGQIAQDLGALAQDLNGRVARGEMTPQERTQAFTAAHQQAQTQVEEVNAILENSRASWAQAVQQRGQTLGETASRRQFAGTAFGNAFSGAMDLAKSGGGAASAGAFRELLGLQQKYAEGMGGFRESPEIPMPASAQQVQGIGIPGYPMPGGGSPGSPGTPYGGGLPGIPGGAPGAATPPMPTGSAGPPLAPPGAHPTLRSPEGQGLLAANEATRQAVEAEHSYRAAGPAGAPRPWTDINTGPSTLPWTGGPQPAASTLPNVGQAPAPTLMSTMGSQLQAGTFDPTQDIAGMVGANADPAWAEAVRRAAARMGYA